MKKNTIYLLFFILSTFNNILKAQVNMSEGSMSFSLPIYGYKDNLSRLSLNTEFSYATGTGFEVDQLSSAVGSKWNLSGIPVVSRILNGLPDDQMEKTGDVYDTTKYPPGYLYNNKSISLGCPTALNKYPIFENKNIWYDDDNKTTSDRQLDIFQFVLNGSQGSFVIDKNFAAVQLDDQRLKVDIITENQTSSKHIRTSIKEFDITDEFGIKYIFSEQETFRISKTNEYYAYPWPVFAKSFEVPLDQNPFVTTKWYVSKIIDTKTNRFISFSYSTSDIYYEQRTNLHVELLFTCPYPAQPYLCNPAEIHIVTPDNHNTFDFWAKNLRGVIENKSIQKKEINSIIFPDASHMDFSYETDRKDLPGTQMLDDISVINADNTRRFKYLLSHSYFIKNDVRIPINSTEEKWSRLCLTSIIKKGQTETDVEDPWKFEYYQGTNNTEDFVPPYFFQAKDIWGYYNGNYSGVATDDYLSDNDQNSWVRVCIYNQPHNYVGGYDIYFNAKNGYAKNGLLKKITNPYGGNTEYEYAQNFYNRQNEPVNSYDVKPNYDISFGGVHISKVTEKIDNNISNDLTTEYNYDDDNGHSTLWGVESSMYQSVQTSYWEAADKYFNGSVCNYHYIYPGRTFATNDAEDNFKKFLGLAQKVWFKYIPALNNISNAHWAYKRARSGSEEQKVAKTEFKKLILNYVINFVVSYVYTAAISCVIDPPFKSDGHQMIYNNAINGNQLPTLFKQVTQKSYSGGNMQGGKTVYKFTSPDDFPLILPNATAGYDNKPRGYMWMYGLPKSVQIFDNTNKPVKSTENEYNLKKNDVQDVKTLSCDCESHYTESLRSDQWNTSATFDDFTTTNINNNGLRLKVDQYNIVTGHSELKKTTEKIFNQANDALTTSTYYLYNPTSNLLSSETSSNSKGAIIESKTFYIEDYNLNNPANSVLNQMKNDHILNVPVSTEVWQTKAGSTTPEMIATSVTEFGIAPNGDYKPVKTYDLQADKPVSLSTIGNFDPDKLIRNPIGTPLIIPSAEINYDVNGNLTDTKDVQGKRNSSTLFGYNNVLPVATITNAASNEIAYTSFEQNDLTGNPFAWNWSNNPGSITDKNVPTGTRYSKGYIISDVISYKNKEYTLSFWANSNKFKVTPEILLTQKASSPTINGWTYYEYSIPPQNAYYTITLDGNGWGIDEVRLYPKNANMTTVTYDPYLGKTADCDINNRINYYEYDGMGRLIKILDENRNIIKTYEYHFKN